MHRKRVSHIADSIPTLHRCTVGQLCKYLPIPNATGKIKSDVRSDVKPIRQREQSNSYCHAASNNQPLPFFPWRPPHDGKTNQKGKSGGEDLNLEKNNKRSCHHSRCYPSAASFSHSPGDKYYRRCSDCHSIQASGGRMLQPEVAVSRVGDV